MEKTIAKSVTIAARVDADLDSQVELWRLPRDAASRGSSTRRYGPTSPVNSNSLPL